MDKYKRPDQIRGRAWFNQFKLRRPQNVDWRGNSLKPFEGLTEECFDNSGFGLDYEPQKISIKTNNVYVSITLFRVVTEYYFVEEYILNRLRFKSKTYNSYEEALRKYDLGEVAWISSESF